MGDLDISLITEFAKRPGFYDRSNPHFKDKEYVAQAWQEISNQLGYDAHLLKDRMYQLRNRYNLEKRRLENMRLEDPSSNLRSPWALFYHLNFLDGHIRPRRSYKRMMKRPIARSNNQHKYQNGHGEAQIKYEESAEDSDDDPQGNEENGSHFLDPSNFLADDSSEPTQSNYGNTAASTPNPVAAAMAASNGATHHSNSSVGINVKNIDLLKRSFNGNDSNSDQTQRKMPRIASRYDKYEAFGRFISASLCDLSEQKALSLVEKFTTDIVQSLMQKNSEEQ